MHRFNDNILALSDAYQRLISLFFNLRLNDGSEGADVTSAGKVFHIFALATGKARSPIVLCFDR